MLYPAGYKFRPMVSSPRAHRHPPRAEDLAGKGPHFPLPTLQTLVHFCYKGSWPAESRISLFISEERRHDPHPYPPHRCRIRTPDSALGPGRARIARSQPAIRARPGSGSLSKNSTRGGVWGGGGATNLQKTNTFLIRNDGSRFEIPSAARFAQAAFLQPLQRALRFFAQGL